MRILDRYILKKFLLPFVYCMVSFILLFIIGDLFENLDNFLEIDNWFPIMVKYYLLYIPSTFAYITAIAILLSLLYSLGDCQKNNEISAMRSAGISVYRITLPLLLFSLFCSGAVFYINENIVLSSLQESEGLKKRQTAGGVEFKEILSDVTYYNPLSNRNFYFETFNPRDNSGTGVTIYELKPGGNPFKRISAAAGAWLDERWWLFDGSIYTFPAGYPPSKRSITKQVFDFETRPRDLVGSKRELSYLSYRELKESIERKKGFPPNALRPSLVELHQKVALPLACLVMGLLGVSFGLKIGRGGMLAGVGISLGLGFFYYIIYSMTGALGKQGLIQPWLAAWTANIIFGLLGGFMLFRLN